MIEKFHYPWEMMPLLYVILKYAKGDLEEASKQLFEGEYLRTYDDTYVVLISVAARMCIISILVFS